jgi:hypothetical protein
MLLIVEWNLLLEMFHCICKLLPCLEWSDHEILSEFMTTLLVGTV